MLLTSSQVSVAISSAIVVAFTAALFLSGYVIQQRTVRHLRAAIRPDSSPQIYLPDRFRDDTTELADGTIVMLDEYGRPVRLKSGRISIGKGSAAAPAHVEEMGNSEDNNELDEIIEIEVQETLPELTDKQGQVVFADDSAAPSWVDGDEVRRQEEEQQEQEQQRPAQEKPVQAPQPAPWELRREDLPEDHSAPSPSGEGEKPISRAERRRLIKEEIQRLSQGEEPLYYQRRLW